MVLLQNLDGWRRLYLVVGGKWTGRATDARISQKGDVEICICLVRLYK